MKAWRIGSGRHPVFDGEGARLFGGRWNSPGRAAIYCGASFAISILERLIYSGIGVTPSGDRWVEAEIPDDLIEHVDEAALPGWDASNSSAARHFGDQWIDEGRSAALVVPSAVTWIDRNIVLNPSHSDFPRIEASAEAEVRWDHRLFTRRIGEI